MLIAQVTDSHVEAPGVLARGRFDSHALFQRALESVKAVAPKPALLLHTGDVTHHGNVENYRDVRTMMDSTGLRSCVLTGNHDEIDALREAFADAPWMPPEPFLHYVIDDLPVRVICLDTTIPKEVGGMLCEKRLAWLAAQLAAGGDRPTLIAMHHPPFRIGRATSDARPFINADKFAALIAAYPNVSLVVAGHVHCTLQARIGLAVAIAAPATCYQFAMDRRPEAGLAVTDEPAGFYLHDWNEAAGFTSQYAPVGDYTATPLRVG
jgi:3',5'-cyclic AMP phosphodiesterase CpdA